MSKAFDTVNRKTLFTALSNVLDQDELHLLSILTNRPNICVRVGKALGDRFCTYQGIMQGDCLSAILFVFYLARALDNFNTTDHNDTLSDDQNTIPESHCDHNYYINKYDYFTCEPKYADDITYASTAQHHINQVEKTVPKKLKAYNLKINSDKTEHFEITMPKTKETTEENQTPKHESEWKKCKLLGRKLDAKTDIKAR